MMLLMLMLMKMTGDAGEMCGSVGGFAALNLIGRSGQKINVERVLIGVRARAPTVAVLMMIGTQIRCWELGSGVGRVGMRGRDVRRADGGGRRRLG